MPKYFAMIDGEQRGPFALEELREAGVTPSTYVWRKGMPDWVEAGDDAEICRYFRQYIFDKMHPASVPAVAEPRKEGAAVRTLTRFGITMPVEDKDEDENVDYPPMVPLIPAILLTLFCFPLTGFFAIYFSICARKSWEDAVRSESKNGRPLYSHAERQECKKDAHDYARKAKMWTGITFFMGLILYSFLTYNFS